MYFLYLFALTKQQQQQHPVPVPNTKKQGLHLNILVWMPGVVSAKANQVDEKANSQSQAPKPEGWWWYTWLSMKPIFIYIYIFFMVSIKFVVAFGGGCTSGGGGGGDGTLHARFEHQRYAVCGGVRLPRIYIALRFDLFFPFFHVSLRFGGRSLWHFCTHTHTRNRTRRSSSIHSKPDGFWLFFHQPLRRLQKLMHTKTNGNAWRIFNDHLKWDNFYYRYYMGRFHGYIEWAE